MERPSADLNERGLASPSSFTGNVLKLVGGTTLAQGISVIAAPILARVYAPHDFGVAAVFVSIVSLLAVIACLRYEYAIMLPERNEDAVNVLAVSVGVVLFLTVFISILFYFAKEPILNLLNAGELRPYLWLIPLSFLVNGVYLALTYWNTRTKQYTRLSVTRAAASLATNISQGAIAVVSQPSSGGLISGSVAGYGVAATFLGAQIWRDDRALFSTNIRYPKILDALRRYRKFPLVDSWGGFLNSLSWQLPALLLSIFFTQATVGYYALAFRLIKLPMSLIGSSVGQVFFQKISEVRDDAAEMANIVEAVFQRLTSIGLFPAFLLTVSGRELFIVVFGEKWAEAGVYVQILGLWMFIWFISSPLSTIFSAFEKQELALIVHFSILITRLIALIAGGLLGNIYIALGLLSGSGILVYGGLALWNMKLAQVPLRSIGKILLKYTLYSAPLIGLVLLIKIMASDTPWIVVLASMFTSVIYLLILIAENFGSRENLYSMLSLRIDLVKRIFGYHFDR